MVDGGVSKINTQIKLTQTDIERVLSTSDQVVRKAYGGMCLSGEHRWAAYTQKEVDFITNECDLRKGELVIDFGCGNGRHAFLLAEQGICVDAVDYVATRIEHAEKMRVSGKHDSIRFISDDCRTVQLSAARVVLCLYDIVGSYTNHEDNMSILRNIFNHLKPGGFAFISVMNYEMTEAQAKYRFSLSSDALSLLELKPSNIMEKTGNVFNPEFYLVDTETKIVYRKEQFRDKNMLPVELVVRDRRYTRNEIEQMCKEVGFEVLFSRYVSAKDWETNLPPTSESAKEILLKCIRPLS